MKEIKKDLPTIILFFIVIIVGLTYFFLGDYNDNDVDELATTEENSEINDDKSYESNEENISVSNKTDDTETTVDNKDGNDWVTLTDNQKFHAVSNALYNLDQDGYIIMESEYYYISALDEFYSDESTLSTSLSKALASIGTMSGTITK